MLKPNLLPQDRKSFKYETICGTGVISIRHRKYTEVLVVGRFTMFGWSFLVHHDINNPEFYSVSEVKSGANLLGYCYPTIEETLREAYKFIEAKRYYFATRVGDFCVRHQCNWERKNKGLSLGLDCVIWNLN